MRARRLDELWFKTSQANFYSEAVCVFLHQSALLSPYLFCRSMLLGFDAMLVERLTKEAALTVQSALNALPCCQAPERLLSVQLGRVAAAPKLSGVISDVIMFAFRELQPPVLVRRSAQLHQCDLQTGGLGL